MLHSFPLTLALITNYKQAYIIHPAHSPAPCAIKGRCLTNEVIGVNSKNGDVCSRRGATKSEWDYFRPPNQKTDRPADRIARTHPVLPCPQTYRHLQRFLLLQAATRRLPWKGKGLGTPVQTQVLRFLCILSSGSGLLHDVLWRESFCHFQCFTRLVAQIFLKGRFV